MLSLRLSSPSSFARRRGLATGEGTASLTPSAAMSQVDALQRLARTANSDQSSGPAKAKRVLKMMELAAVRPRYVRSGPNGCGWWSNDYEDLAYC